MAVTSGFGAAFSDTFDPEDCNCKSETGLYLLHGVALEIACSAPQIESELETLLGDFALSRHPWPAGASPITGTIEPYNLDRVCRRLSATARRVTDRGATTTQEGDRLEIYEENDRFWLVDERWGMSEVDLAMGEWRSWVAASPSIHPVRCAEMAVLWPMAQLLREFGIHLVPAVSVVRDGWSVLILGTVNLEPELTAMVEQGYRLIGQRWTAIREEEGRIALLRVPGGVQRSSTTGGECWVDLTAARRSSRQTHAFCDSVLFVNPGRRDRPGLREAPPAESLSAMRHSWPIPELHPSRRRSILAGQIARYCRCAEVNVSRDPRDFLALLDELHARGPVSADAEGVIDAIEHAEQTAAWNGSRAAAA